MKLINFFLKLIILAFRALLGGLSIIAFFYGAILIFEDNRIESFLLIICGSFFFILISGNIKRPLYLLILPVMVFSFFAGEIFGEGALLFFFFCTAISSSIITRHYSKKDRDQGVHE